MVHVGADWRADGSERDGSAYPAPLRWWVPEPTRLADDVAGLVRSLEPGWSRSGLVVGAYETACRHIGFDHSAVPPTALEPGLYHAKLRLPDRTLALAVDGLDDPRDLAEVGLRLAGIDARNATLVTGTRPGDPGVHRLFQTLHEASNDVARPVMAALDRRLGRDVQNEAPAPGREGL